jgi:hypothetical protein
LSVVRTNGPMVYEYRSDRSKCPRFHIWGFHLLALFWSLNLIFPSVGFSIQKLAISTLLLGSIGLLAMEIHSVSNIRGQAKTNFFGRCFVYLIVSWFLIAFIRGIEGDSGRLMTLIANPNVGGIVWLVPLALFIGRFPPALSALYPVFRLHTILAIIASLCLAVTAAVTGPNFNVGSLNFIIGAVALELNYAAPLLLLAGMGTRADRYLYALAIIVWVLVSNYIGVRVNVALGIGYLIISFALGRSITFWSILRKVTLAAVAITAVVVLIGLSDWRNLDVGWTQDTRTFLWEETAADFGVLDWIIGRGALGSYFSQHFHDWSYNVGGIDWQYRQGVEVGFLHLTLKTGLIGAVLYILVLFNASLRILRFEESRVAVGLAIYFAIHLVELFVSAPPGFTLSYLFLWTILGFALFAPHRSKFLRD